MPAEVVPPAGTEAILSGGSRADGAEWPYSTRQSDGHTSSDEKEHTGQGPHGSSGDHKMSRESQTVCLVARTLKAVGGTCLLLRRLSESSETETPTSESYFTT